MKNARYNSSDNTLKEISQMEKPVKPKMGLAKSSFDGAMERYTKQLAAYEKHVASLRTLPCHPSCKTVWKEGDVLEEGKDYKIKHQFLKGIDPETGGDIWTEPLEQPFYRSMNVSERLVAFPLVPVKSEDDPYEELLTMIARSSWDRNEIIAEAKKQFIVTKR